ncbi:MAG: Fic family protein [Proteobacteria bacterium]|nr:MAG: Fic family protein [Pseudomonadota bacterium]
MKNINLNVGKQTGWTFQPNTIDCFSELIGQLGSQFKEYNLPQEERPPHHLISIYFLRYLSGGGVIKGLSKDADLMTILKLKSDNKLPPSLSKNKQNIEIKIVRQIDNMIQARKLFSEVITFQDLLKAQKSTVKNQKKHGIRKKQYWVGDKSKNNSSFYTCHPQQIEKLLLDLLVFINNTEIDPLVKVAILVHQFAMIHPFKDGNGRVLRILIMQILAEKCDEVYISILLFYIKILADRELYDSIEKLRNGSFTDFLTFWTNCLRWSDDTYLFCINLLQNDDNNSSLAFKIIEFDYYLKMMKRDFDSQK